MCGYQVPENLACYLKKHKVIVFKMNASGAYLNPISSIVEPAKDLPCKADFSQVYRSKLDPWTTYISVYWNDETNNGNCFFQTDALVPKSSPTEDQKVYRNIGSCFVTKDDITFNFADDAEGFLQVKGECIYFSENRVGTLEKDPYTNNASNVKVSSVCERNKVLGCKK